MGWVLMDGRELHRVGVLTEILDGGRSAASGAAVLGLTARHTRRLVERFRTRGASSLADRLRGCPSNRRKALALREQALDLVRTHYQGYGPTLASEMLLERHGLRVPRETLRGWMRAGGLWLTRAQRRVFHQSRPRRRCCTDRFEIWGCPTLGGVSVLGPRRDWRFGSCGSAR